MKNFKITLTLVIFAFSSMILCSCGSEPKNKGGDLKSHMSDSSETTKDNKESKIVDSYFYEKLRDAKVGDYILFGTYEQDNNTSNGKEDIEWLVLEIKDGKALIISKYALDCQPYNRYRTVVTWETCTLRKWLNNDFVDAAFSAEEKAMILTATVSADKNPEYSTNPGKAVRDQVFLLSITEASKYFSSDSARQCKPTDYAIANGAWESDSGNGWWWLRSPGMSLSVLSYAAYVGNGGVINAYGNAVDKDNGAVRPALWIDMSDSSETTKDNNESKIFEIVDSYFYEKMETARVGDCVIFGAYEQDNNISNGKEDIVWLVLEIKDGKALIISKYALDCQPYNRSYTDVTWETCTLREWLNNDFVNAAFSAEEQAIIPTVTVYADKNPEYSTNPGNATQDKIFLLSITEASKYFSSDSARQYQPTDYAVAEGAFESDFSNCVWWLRSPGINQTLAAGVDAGGDVYEYGYWVNYDNLAVRPALWIDLNS